MNLIIKHTYKILATAVVLILSGCADNALYPEDKNKEGDGNLIEAIIHLEYEVPEAEERTRSDEMGNTDITSIWVGVYDIETGNRVGSSFNTSNLSSGKVAVPVIYYDAHPDVVIVGVANYNAHDDVFRDWNGNTMESCLKEADTWEKFMNINVKCPTTDQGVPKPVTDYQQIMTGLLTSPDSKRPFFKKKENGGVDISNATGCEVTLTSTTYGSMIKEITGRKIYFQRLYSKVNVVIKTENNAEVANVSYRLGNIPKAVYIAERPTFTGNTKNWNPWIENTPNFADTRLSPNGVSNAATGDGYYTEETWTSADRDNTFTFYHYENKHWGWTESSLPYAENQYYLNREDKTGECITLLGNGYNTYGSYFVVRMTILDRSKNKSATVEYVIHEGNCNNPNGEGSTNNYWDYCVFRNMVYNYTLNVNGNGMVTYNVESDNISNNKHHDGNSGIIWTADIGKISTQGYNDGNPWGEFTVPAGHNNIVYRFYQCNGVDNAPSDYIISNFSKEDLLNLKGMYWPTIDENTIFQTPSQCSLGSLFWFFDLNNIDEVSIGWPFQYFSYVSNHPGRYRIHMQPSDKNAQWFPEAYKVGFYYYDPEEVRGSNLADFDGCTKNESKVCHVYEWQPAQRQKETLYITGNLPTQTNLPNYITPYIELDFSNVSYRTDYDANVSTLDYEIHVKLNGRDYTLDSNKKCTIPLTEVGSATGYSVYAVSLNSVKYINSKEYAVDNSISFYNPSWDFTQKPGNYNFSGWTYDDSKKMHSFKGPQTYEYNGLSLYCSGTGKEIQWDEESLNLENSGTGCDVIFTVYQNCKIIIKGEKKARQLHIDGGDITTIDMTNQTTSVEIPVTMGSETSKQITIYYTGGGARLYSISISK
ncbi:MAG: hypothetical protein J1E82_01805 [Muribaculaceae bacterium]|nr:hypothetical protein [Muribaculaceae bacterium]